MDLIKSTIQNLIESGESIKTVYAEARKMYNGNSKSFDNTYGRFIRRQYKKLKGGKGGVTGTVSYSANKNGEMDTNLSAPYNGKLLTPEEMMLANGMDPTGFTFENARVSIWDAQTADGVQRMQSMRVGVSKNLNVSEQEILNIIKNRINKIEKAAVEAPKSVAYNPSPENKIAVWHMGDCHFGRECLKEEVGIDWNLDLAEKDIWCMVNQMIAQLKANPVSKILFAFTGDGINADTMDGCTAHGTPQDMSSRHYQVFERFFNLMCSVIEKTLDEVRVPIEVIHVIGNHDEQTMYNFVAALRGYFKNNDNVEVSVEFNRRKYRKYGNNLLMFTHGDTEKNRILDLPWQEEPEAFGSVKYCYIFTEHLHNLKTTTKGQVYALQTCSPAPGDRWTVKSGYVGSRRGSELLIFDKEKGLKNETFLHVESEDTISFVKEID